MMIYTSFVLIAGNENLLVMMGVTWTFFIVQYGMIVSLEEKTLYNLFGDEYNIYRKNVSALIPRISPWQGGISTKPNHLLKTLKTEKRTLQNIMLVLLLIILRNQV